MKTYKLIIYTVLLLMITSCDKAEFLDKKPSASLVVPTKLEDFRRLLDNTNIFNFTGGLAQMSGDDYYMENAQYMAGITTQRNAYIWAKDIYIGEGPVADWFQLYREVFYANAVLDGLGKSSEIETAEGQYIKGWALFARAYAFYDLARGFCKSYDAATANQDLGIPLRLTASIDYTADRGTLQKTFDQILGDLATAEPLLPTTRQEFYQNRPSKVALYALLARIYLDMRNYTEAESYADKCLNTYNQLIDYNTVNKTTLNPFLTPNDELIYNVSQVAAYSSFTNASAAATGAKVLPQLIATYSDNDLRKVLYFTKLVDNTYTKKNGYYGFGSTYPFTGLATDEVYLIKAECLARRNQTQTALTTLDQLLVKRWNPGATNPSKPYQNAVASTPEEALSLILLERRKELVWRGLRWYDLKRLNKSGANITLTRTVNGNTYSLPPNDLRYVFPIPDDEILLSGIQQNLR